MSQQQTPYHAHPAFTLREMKAGDPLTLLPERLGFRWLKRNRIERQRQETAFFSTLLTALVETPEVTLLAEFPEREKAQAFADTWRLRCDGYEVAGECTPEIVEALTRERFDHAQIRNAEGRAIIEIETPWEGVAVWLDDKEAPAWRQRLQNSVKSSRADHQAGNGERPFLAALYIFLANATWIVPSLLGIAAMIALNGLGVSSLIAVPLGFIFIAALILGPPVRYTRRALRRLI